MQSTNQIDPAPASLGADPRSAKRWVLWGLFGLSLIFQLLIYTAITSKPVIRSDGVGYHAYLPAALADRDLSLETLGHREFPEGIPSWTGMHPGPRGHVIKYPLGVALLQAPFFVGAQLVAAIIGSESSYAAPYQIATAVAGAWYFGWGCLFVWLLLRRWFEPGVSALALLLTIFGTNLLHYGTYDAAFSHVYSFFLAAALLVSCRQIYGAGINRWLATGLLAGLTIVTRPTNIVFLVFVAADWMADAGSVPESWRRLGTRGREIAGAALAAFAPIGLQMAYWKAATGSWVFYSYGREGFDFFHPEIVRVLFSFEKGWFVYLPLTLLAVIGWIVARGRLPYTGVILPFAGVNLWIIASWHDWGYGGSFSMRPLMEASPLVALGVAGLLWRAWPSAWARPSCLVVGVLCATYTGILMLGYWVRALPYIGATGHDIVHCLTFGWLRAGG